VAGLALLERVFAWLDPAVRLSYRARDGEFVHQGTAVAEAEGPVRALLMGERTALNFVQRLSGTATLTRSYVDAVRGFSCRIIDTRKTTPGLRALEKYAVRMGGGTNHRLGLYDAALVKDNHIVAAGSIAGAVDAVRRQAPFMAPIEVECATLSQVQEALDVKVGVIMLDNMKIDDMAAAVNLIAKRALVEASGGITLESVRAVAATGVDYISVGALTHSAPAEDFNMKITASPRSGSSA
jgi:nicotinate-nucleotide pyrophosphorylase (carboxylating)